MYIIYTKSTTKLRQLARLKSRYSIPLCLIFLLISLIYFNSAQSIAKLPQKRIGISQIVDHPALNAVRQGIIAALKEHGFEAGKNLTIIEENAQGNLALATQISAKLISLPLDVAVSISTPATQSLLHTAEKQQSTIPIVFSAVTDPKSLSLDPEKASYPITGVTDAPIYPRHLNLSKN